MAEDKSPLDQAVDQALELLVYAPVGLALTARDELPRWVTKGRERVTGQIAMAKMIGQFAVKQGQQEARKRGEWLATQAGEAADRLASRAPAPSAPSKSAPAPSAPAAPAPAAARVPVTAGRAKPGQGRSGPSSTNGAQSGAAAAAVSSARASGRVPKVSGLAIPGYDTLSASQVVQRLGGLSASELEAVGHYEDATRGRRTILSKVVQLQAGPSARS
jgi:hypothetical protein